jgi:hypothetical protein
MKYTRAATSPVVSTAKRLPGRDRLGRSAAIKPISDEAIKVLHQLFIDGPVWDGYIASSKGRGELLKLGLADRVNGFSFLTNGGMRLSVSCYEMEKIA